MREIARRAIGLTIFVVAVLVSPTYLPVIYSFIIGIVGLLLVTVTVTRQ